MIVFNTDFVFVTVFLPNHILIVIVDFFVVVIVYGIHMVLRYPHDPLLTISRAGITIPGMTTAMEMPMELSYNENKLIIVI